MSDLIISVSGLRGVVGSSLTPDVASRYVSAFARRLNASVGERRPLVIVGRDGRDSGPVLRDIVVASLRACGCDVLDADVVATPTIGVLVRARNADGAIQITASHNPPPYNGMKLFGPSGRVLDAVSGAEVRKSYMDQESAWVSHDRLGDVQSVQDAHAPHLASVLATVDREAIAARKYRVLLDSNHGAGGALGCELLKQLGCEIVLVGGVADGQFEHVPEPTAENLQMITARVVAERCEVGFCQDPDADRLALIDAGGRYIGEEYTLALCVQRALADPTTRGPIVINGATSGMSEMVATEAGVMSHRSAVGEANVVDLMIATGATYGGEGNGGPIDPRVGMVRDSFVGIAQVLDLMAKTGKPLAGLADALPQLAIHKTKVTLDATKLSQILAAVAAANPDAHADHSDGLRLSWPGEWLLVRGSNTEPIVRMIAEADSPQRASELCESAASIIARLNQGV
ncbi:MAG TPA: phosphoglucosamine mutase [Planctomycetaceae bacterium]|nr:phosphoglucosamine mutase [Planctomycetaceae bacterium]